MTRIFEELNLTDIAVETNVSDLRGKMNLRYGRDSAIHLSLFPESFSLSSIGPVELSVRSIAQPTIVIPRAWIARNNVSINAQSGMSNELVLAAPQLTIESGKPTGSFVSAGEGCSPPTPNTLERSKRCVTTSRKSLWECRPSARACASLSTASSRFSTKTPASSQS